MTRQTQLHIETHFQCPSFHQQTFFIIGRSLLFSTQVEIHFFNFVLLIFSFVEKLNFLIDFQGDDKSTKIPSGLTEEVLLEVHFGDISALLHRTEQLSFLKCASQSLLFKCKLVNEFIATENHEKRRSRQTLVLSKYQTEQTTKKTFEDLNAVR